jgi:Cof subfamily protein (haloacid dehalogenase superfamily)
MRYRLLAIDIDGTLVNSRDELTPATRDALFEAGEAGIQLVLATGRRYSQTIPLVEPLGIDVPLVTASGALVKNPRDHQTLFRAEFDRAMLCRIVQMIDQAGYDSVLCTDTFDAGFDFYVARQDVESEELGQYLRQNPESGRIWPQLVDDPPHEVFEVFAMGARTEMLDLERRLSDRLPNQLTMHVLRSPKYGGFFLEIAPAGVTKWSAIQRLATRWGIPDNAICAVGDDVNDIPMIQAAGLGVAMGNALPEVKAAADRIAPTHDENGLVRVVQWILQVP